MKTKVEVLGYEIEIEEVDGVVTVKAELDGETVEEFTLEPQEEGQSQDDEDGDDDVKGFGDFDAKEEDDFEGQSQSQSQDTEDGDFEEDEEDDHGKETLESFQTFINKR